MSIKRTYPTLSGTNMEDLLVVEMAPYRALDTSVTSAVRQITYGRGTGTAFWFQTDIYSGFVTAKHLVANAATGDNILMSTHGEPKLHKVSSIWHHPMLDVALFKLEAFEINCPTFFGVPLVGRPCLYPGFPHGKRGRMASGFPTPLVRSGHVCAWTTDSQKNNLLLLDVWNNPGASGSPVFVGGGTERASGGTVHAKLGFVGIVSNYIPENKTHSMVCNQHNQQATSYYANANSGMTQAIAALDIYDFAKQSTQVAGTEG